MGDRLRLALDADLCAAVTGAPAALAHPGLVCDVAIGQSTLVTQRVKANLFYRGLTFHPIPGDRRHPVHPHRSGRAARELGQAGPAADRPGGAAHDHHRPGRSAGAGLLPVRDAARSAPDCDPEAPTTPTTCRRSAPSGAAAGRRPPTGTARRSAPGARAALRRRPSPDRCCTAPPTWSPARPSWPASP